MVGESLGQSSSSTETLDAVSSIQLSNADAIAAQRKHRRFDIRLKVAIQPGNSSDRGAEQWLGECHDISQGGCRLLTQKPLQLGSIYWVQFEPGKVQIDPVFARCVRGHLMRETAFEFGMSFLTPIELPEPEDSTEAGVNLL